MVAESRGIRVALLGLLTQLALAGVTIGLWVNTGMPAVWPAVWLVLAPVPVWILSLVLFYARELRRREAAELELLARAPGREGIFTEGDQVHPAANRVRRLERYLVPIFTLLWAGYHGALGVLLLNQARRLPDIPSNNASAALFFCLGAFFAAFLLSRYATGMAKTPAWSLLRSPGSYLFTNAVAFLLLVAAFAVEHYRSAGMSLVLAYAFPAFMIVIAVELVLNFVLDIYRPRLPGVEHRFSYDSRLLNLIASPESIGHSIAEALNYQFGFEVSSTWFYQLLQRALAPLLLAGAALVWLATSVVVVDQGEQYVLLHWGKQAGVLSPRAYPYLVWPWPIDQTVKFETGKVHEINLGLGGERTETLVNGKRIRLWAEEHGDRVELDTVVAAPPTAIRTRQDVPPVAVVKLVVLVRYQIADPVKYGFTMAEPEKVLEAEAARAVSRFTASATVDDPRSAGATTAPAQTGTGFLLSRGRLAAETELSRLVTTAFDNLDMGVKVVGVQVQSLHPPKDAAAAFEAVVGAEREQDSQRFAAQAEANRILANVGGDPDEALRFSQFLRVHEDLTSLATRRGTAGFAAMMDSVLTQARQEQEKLHVRMQSERQPGVVKELLTGQDQHVGLLDKVKAETNAQAQGPLLDQGLKDASVNLEKSFANIQGHAAVVVAQARADRWKREFQVWAQAQTFDAQLQVLQAAPQVVRLEKYLAALGEGIKDSRKYVVGVEPARVDVYVNVEQPANTVGDIGFTKPESK